LTVSKKRLIPQAGRGL